MTGFGITDKGKVRIENQDTFLLDLDMPGAAVCVLCDGMGGARAGSVASELGAQSFMAHVRSCIEGKDKRPLKSVAAEAANFANIKIFDRSYTDMSCRGMGTTLVGAILTDTEAVIANVGDSRAYLVSDGSITRITRDHSYVEEMVQRGDLTREEARSHPRKNLITRAMGLEPGVDCDLFTPELKDGDILLFCSDGLTNEVEESEILQMAREHMEAESLAKNLLDLALNRDARDNITIIVFII